MYFNLILQRPNARWYSLFQQGAEIDATVTSTFLLQVTI